MTFKVLYILSAMRENREKDLSWELHLHRDQNNRKVQTTKMFEERVFIIVIQAFSQR